MIIRGMLEMMMVAYLSSSASWARSAVLCMSDTMPGSGWLLIRMARRTNCRGCLAGSFR